MLRPILNNNSAKAIPGDSKKKIPPLKQGALIKGTVLQKLKDGDFIISTGDKEFRAYSSLPLKDGQNYNFIVRSLKDKIELRVLGEDSRITGDMTGLLSSVKGIGQRITTLLSAVLHSQPLKNMPKQTSDLVTRLQSLLNHPISGKNISELVTWINKNIQGSGIFWETKVLQLLTGKKDQMPKDMTDTDLKGILLKLLKSLEKNPDEKEGIKALATKVREAVHLIEQEQIMNINAMREGLGWFVHLPFVNDDDFLSSGLYIKEENKGSLNFSMFLDMSFTGKMNIDISVIRESIGILINVENEMTKKFIMEGIGELDQAFKAMGLSTGNIRCEVHDKLDIADSLGNKDIQSSVDLMI